MKHWSITLYSIYPSTLLLRFDGDPSCLWVKKNLWALYQTYKSTKGISMLGEKMFEKRHLSCLDVYLVSIWACKKQFQHMKCTRLWIHEDSTFPQSSPGWTCIIMFKTKVPIERQCASMRLMCVNNIFMSLCGAGSALCSLRAKPGVSKHWSYGAGRNNSVSGKRSAISARLHQVREKHEKRRKEQTKVARARRICFQ